VTHVLSPAGKTTSAADSAEVEELHMDINDINDKSQGGEPGTKQQQQQQHSQQQPLSTEQGLWTPPSRIALARMPDPSLSSAASPEEPQPPSALPTPAQAPPPPHTHDDHHAPSAEHQQAVRVWNTTPFALACGRRGEAPCAFWPHPYAHCVDPHQTC
jgi:hypothetical protein